MISIDRNRMESLRRKRKGAKSSSVVGSYLSDGVDHARQIKKCCRSQRNAFSREKVGSCSGGATAGAVMTAPPSGRPLASSPGRGLKRKLGCIDPVTSIGRKKKLEHEYTLGREIGKGRFGAVRLCRSRASGEEFACKTLPKNGEETVHREVEIMQHLSGHPGIVTLKAVFEDSESFHLVMELCSGGRLIDEMVREGRYSEQRVAVLMKELVSVIKYCHEMGVAHRDIKPENILLTTAGKIKLADFGLAIRIAGGNYVGSYLILVIFFYAIPLLGTETITVCFLQFGYVRLEFNLNIVLCSVLIKFATFHRGLLCSQNCYK